MLGWPTTQHGDVSAIAYVTDLILRYPGYLPSNKLQVDSMVVPTFLSLVTMRRFFPSQYLYSIFYVLYTTMSTDAGIAGVALYALTVRAANR